MNYYAVFIADGGHDRMKKIFADFKRNLHTCVNNVDIFVCEEPIFNEAYALVENSVFSKKHEEETEEELRKIRNRNKTRRETPPPEKLDFVQHKRRVKK